MSFLHWFSSGALFTSISRRCAARIFLNVAEDWATPMSVKLKGQRVGAFPQGDHKDRPYNDPVADRASSVGATTRVALGRLPPLSDQPGMLPQSVVKAVIARSLSCS